MIALFSSVVIKLLVPTTTTTTICGFPLSYNEFMTGPEDLSKSSEPTAGREACFATTTHKDCTGLLTSIEQRLGYLEFPLFT